MFVLGSSSSHLFVNAMLLLHKCYHRVASSFMRIAYVLVLPFFNMHGAVGGMVPVFFPRKTDRGVGNVILCVFDSLKQYPANSSFHFLSQVKNARVPSRIICNQVSTVLGTSMLPSIFFIRAATYLIKGRRSASDVQHCCSRLHKSSVSHLCTSGVSGRCGVRLSTMMR